MCGRYTITPSRGELEASFPEVSALPQDRIFAERFNVAPTQEILAITRPDRDGPAQAELLRWGLVPKWAKAPDDGVKMINARAETVSEKPSYRDLFADSSGRCLVLADGFYEWEPVPGGRKQPWRFSLTDGSVFALAGLCTSWHSGECRELRSCTVITTAANSLVEPVHDRMPVVLTGREAMASWLDPEISQDALRELLAPLDPSLMLKKKAALAVGKPANEGPSLLMPEQPDLFSDQPPGSS